MASRCDKSPLSLNMFMSVSCWRRWAPSQKNSNGNEPLLVHTRTRRYVCSLALVVGGTGPNDLRRRLGTVGYFSGNTNFGCAKTVGCGKGWWTNKTSFDINEDNKSNVYRKPLDNRGRVFSILIIIIIIIIEEDIILFCTQNAIRDEITRSRLPQNDVAGVFFPIQLIDTADV